MIGSPRLTAAPTTSRTSPFTALETVRKRLRGLIGLIDKTARQPIYTDFEDTIGEAELVTLEGAGGSGGFERFRVKARAFLRKHDDNIVQWNAVIARLREENVVQIGYRYMLADKYIPWLLTANGSLPRMDLEEGVGNPWVVEATLKRLVARGLVVKEGQGRGTRYRMADPSEG